MCSGVYKIVNKLNNKMYIGSTCDFESRWKHHKKNLRKGKGSKVLQRAWDKYGEGVFEFSVAEYVSGGKEILIEREQYYTDLLEPEYSMLKECVGSLLGYKHTDESRKNNSEAQKICQLGEKNGFYGKHHTEETKKKHSNFMRGRKLSEEHKRKIGDFWRGKPKSPEANAKQSASMKGVPKSEEHKKNMRRPHKKGYKQTEEHKRNILASKARKKLLKGLQNG
jgi:group I intron endonuclease